MPLPSVAGDLDPTKGQVEMTTNRYLEALKRLLSAETYFRSRQRTEKRESEPPVPEDKSK